MREQLFNSTRRYAFAFALVSLLSVSAPNAGPIEVVNTLSINESEDRNVKAGQVDNCSAYFEGTRHMASCRDGEVPTPAAIWLFSLILIAFVGLANKRKL